MNIGRLAGGFYSITFLTGAYALFVGGRFGRPAILVATVAYVAVTVAFYVMFKPVSQRLSLFAALVGVGGCVAGALGLSPLPIFGVYCATIGYLILRSAFIPAWLGVLMMLAGGGWLTFLSKPFVAAFAPYVYLPGLLGEGALTAWLLVFGASATRATAPNRAR